MEKAKRFLVVLLVAASLFLSQVACDDEAPGCKSTACRDSCGGDNSCRIECCNGTRSGWF